jgi:hypothetical protein
MKYARPDFDRYVKAHVMIPREVRPPELLHRSILDPRIIYPPVINKSAYRKLMRLVVRIKQLLSAPGIL